MSEEWDTVTTIGKSGRGTRPTVARTQAEVNAARRAGAIVGTEKKVCHLLCPGPPLQSPH